MSQSKGDQAFVDAIPEIYERLLVPLIFESYAVDLARRVAAILPLNVLEIAAGTGVLTRQLARALPDGASIVATDLNAPMLAQARARGTQRAVQWEVADALNLPHEDGRFDAVACQFGVMFFPDKSRGYSEVRRVLRPRGRFFFNGMGSDRGQRGSRQWWSRRCRRVLRMIRPACMSRHAARLLQSNGHRA